MTTDIPRCRCGVPRTDSAPLGCYLPHGAFRPDSDASRARVEVLMRALEDAACPIPAPDPPTALIAPVPWPSR